MGGTPLFALNLTAWPRESLPLELLAEVLAGGADVAAAGGWVVAGGHTVDGAEPMYGQAVMGEVDADRILTNADGRAGDALVLTKPIGTGLVATMVKRSDPAAIAADGPRRGVYDAAVTEMVRLNDVAARIALASGSTCATDVTGFGLLGHLHRLAAASGLAATVVAGDVPTLPGVDALLAEGTVPGGTLRNLDFVRPHVDARGEVDDRLLTLLADAQTSGGLLFTCRPEQADGAVVRLRDTGHDAARIGELVDGTPGTLIVD
jgi:selenide,water dikinase